MAYVSPTALPTGTLITDVIWNQDIVNNEKASAPDVFTTKGDLFAATAADTGARVGAGSNGQLLKADSGEAAGIKWGSLLTGRQGGSASVWDTSGTTDYTPALVSIQVGTALITITGGGAGFSDTVTVTFPTTFSNKPVPFISGDKGSRYYAAGDNKIIDVDTVGAATLIVRATFADFTPRPLDETVRIFWIAIGPP